MRLFLSSLFITRMVLGFKLTILLNFSFLLAVKSITKTIIVFDRKPGMMS